MNVNEYNNLLNKYIKLLFEKNKLIMRDAPYIESRYLFHFGDLMVKELEHNKNIKVATFTNKFTIILNRRKY